MLGANSIAGRMMFAIAGVLLACQSAVAGIDLSRVIRFDIPAQGLDAALLEFSRQAQVQIIVESRLAEARSTPKLNGEYARGSALEILLSGSGLTFRAVGNAAIAIQADNAGEQSSAPTTSSLDDERARAAATRHAGGASRRDVFSRRAGPSEPPDEPERLG